MIGIGIFIQLCANFCFEDLKNICASSTFELDNSDVVS